MADKGHYHGAQKEENIYLVIGSDKQNIEIGTPCAKYNPIFFHHKPIISSGYKNGNDKIQKKQHVFSKCVHTEM